MIAFTVVTFVAAFLAAAALPAVTADARPDLPAVLVSRQLAAHAGLRTGDTVTLELDAITASPSDPGSVESVKEVNVRLADPNDAAAFASALAARAPGIFARPTARTRDGPDPFVVLERFHLAVATVTVLGSTAFLLALMTMRAEERRETVGIIRLIGVSQRSILMGVLVEGLLIATSGAVFGILVAVAAQGAINRFFQWRYDTALVFVRVTMSIALRSIMLSVPLGIVAGLVG